MCIQDSVIKLGSEIACVKPKAKKGAGPLMVVLGWFAALGFITYVGYQGYKAVSNYRVESNITQSVNTAATAVASYSNNGASCDGFGTAQLKIALDDRYIWSGRDIVVPGGDITMNAACLDEIPGIKTDNTSMVRGVMRVFGVNDDVCINVANTLINPQTPVVGFSIRSGSGVVVIKDFKERIPSGRDQIGVTACAPDTYSNMFIMFAK